MIHMAKTSYHHGNLKEDLVASAAQVLAEEGLSGFSLREVARRTGVSHAAPGHHFGSAEVLLSHVAAQGFNVLADNVAEAAEGVEDPGEKMIAAGKAYIRTALDNPGHFSVMMGSVDGIAETQECEEAGQRAFEQIVELSAELIQARGSDMNPLDLAFLCWSTVHGYAMLQDKVEKIADIREVVHSLDDSLRIIVERI